jgi:hypothetical protein
MLDCDRLRVIGCSLGKNDWDLVSMLFSTRHAHGENRGPYVVELIDKPQRAQVIKERFPYLDAKTLLEIDDIGPNIYVEASPGAEAPYLQLPENIQAEVRNKVRCDGNPFRYWLKHKGEVMDKQDRARGTRSGLFHDFLDSY